MDMTSNLRSLSSSVVSTTTESAGLSPVIADQDLRNSSTVEMINNIAYNYVALLIVAMGIVGNILNLMVLTRPKLKGVMYVYLLGLAVSNLCVLIIAIPALVSLTSPSCSPSYLRAYFQAYLMMPLLNSFMAWSVYIIICMTVNRYISIYMPTYFQRIHTFKNAYVAILGSFLGGLILHIPLCFEYTVTTCNQNEGGPVGPAVTPSGNVPLTYKMSSNQVIAEHPLYNVYIYVSETLLRLGPIVTLTILNILIIVRFNRIAKKREHLKGPAVHRTPTNKNTIQRSVSPIACVTDQVHSNGNNGNLLAVPSTNGNPPVISVDHAHSTVDVQVETDQKTNTTALTVMEGCSASALTAKCDRSGSVTSARLLSARGTPSRASTRRRGLHNPEERMLVVVLIAIVVLFVICTTPAAFLSLSVTDERKKMVNFSIFRACANNLELLGFALNFVVYCLCSADIRAAFVDVLFENWIVAAIRNQFSKSQLEEQHELQVVEKSAVVASIHNQKLVHNAANV